MDSANEAESMLSVYTRHYPPCPSKDINYKRCRCPKWINGIVGPDGPFIRRSAKTRNWEKAEEFKRQLEAQYHAKQNAGREAVIAEPEKVAVSYTGELFLYRAKTGNPVYVPLPPDVAAALGNIPPGPSPNPRYFFWSGNGSPKSVVGNWQRSFRRLFKIANLRRDDGSLKRCHPHMFRDTFAVEMLLAGVPLEQVSILLGHKSVKITEKHYAPWVKARQEQLATSVRKAWGVSDTDNKKPRRKQPQRTQMARVGNLF
jgi:integrase